MRIGGQQTVYERMRGNGGFLSSPYHALQGMGDNSSPLPGDPAATAESAAAPNYREADQPQVDCADCEYLDQATCTKYNFRPKLYYVCDSFEPADGNDSEDAADDSEPDLPLPIMAGR